ncbi:MAG: hypothetical protein ACYC1L_13785 [Alphaproteobacteria bacterium]
MRTVDSNRVIVTGENPFIRLSETDGGPNTTEASYWRVFYSPAGTGHVLYLKSELTANRWSIYSDNLALTRWLQKTVQGMLNAELKDEAIPVTDAQFSKAGDPNDSWIETVSADGDEVALTWYEMGDPLLIHTQPGTPAGRPYGLSTVLIPAARATITRNGVQASGHAWPREREGRPFSTCALAFAESWTERR